MMRSLPKLITLTLLLHLFLTTKAQIGYSPNIDSLIQEIDYDSLLLLNRQLTGDTSVFINGVLDTIVSRHSDHPDNELAAQFLIEKYNSFGLDIHVMNYDSNGQNIIATIPGDLYPDQQYIICAHYDSRPEGELAPGSDDNGTGVCAVLEAARLASGHNFPYTLKFINFDEEEQGLTGSTAYVDSAFANGDNILGVLNLDMIGWDSDTNFKASISSNEASMGLLKDNMACMALYTPELNSNAINFGGSDHYRFWGKSYKAIHFQEDRRDHTPYYHTTDDNFSNLNKEYFLKMVRAAVATFLSWGWDCSMDLSHEPLLSSADPGPREVSLVADSLHPFADGTNAPRLYYSVDGGPFEFTHAYNTSQDTLEFIIPGFPYGSEVAYYFAMQDAAGTYVKTLPDAGKGINPPGTIAPPEVYSYSILKKTQSTFTASDVPVAINPQDTAWATVNIINPGRVIDVNVSLDIQQTFDWDLEIYLESPQGQRIDLSSENGFLGANYTSTVFDDEAGPCIKKCLAPFTGSFEPEQPLSAFDGQSVQGTWRLMVVNLASFTGQILDFGLEITYGTNDYYVDASQAVSGDGMSWSTAFKTISEATQMDPGPGSHVFVKPGTYHESLNIISNGEQTIPFTTGIEVFPPNIIQFPAGTDLSAIDLANSPGEFYVYLYRSLLRNSGYFVISDVDDAQDVIYLLDASFIHETSTPGDTNSLSCCVGRPVQYQKFSSDPENERVNVDADGLSTITTLLYIGEPIGDGSQDALPADFNIIDGFDLTGSAYGGGIHLQSSSFNVVKNTTIFENSGKGIFIDGNETHPACHNFIVNNDIYNTLGAGIYIGLPQLPVSNNYSNYNHLIGNNISCSGSGPNAHMERAIFVGRHNKGSVIRDNICRDVELEQDSRAICEVQNDVGNTLIFGNLFRNNNSTASGHNSIIWLYGNNSGIEAFNNIISDSLSPGNNLYAFRIDGTNSDSSRVVHNTIYHIDKGFYLEDYSDMPDFDIQNNIIYVHGLCYDHSGTEGRFHITNNLYLSNPTPDTNMAYSNEPGRQIGMVAFSDPANGDFHLRFESDPALCSGASLTPAIELDPDCNFRCEEYPDVGAYELKNKFVWSGSADENWFNATNWNTGSVPDCNANVVIEENVNLPVINSGVVQCKGIMLKDGASLTVGSTAHLEILGVD